MQKKIIYHTKVPKETNPESLLSVSTEVITKANPRIVKTMAFRRLIMEAYLLIDNGYVLLWRHSHFI